MRMMRTALSSAGRTSGSVTLRSVWIRVAPDIRADSSSDGSMDRNAATMSRKTMGEECRPSTQIIPQMVKMSNGADPRIGSSAALSRPICGLARKIHEIV